MSTTAAVAADGGRSPAVPRPVRAEAWATLKLAGPLAATQLAQMAINTTDVLMLGWLGPEPLAAASLGFALFYFLFLGGMGLVSAASPLLAQALGAGRTVEARRLTQQGFLVVVGAAVPLMLLATQGRPILAALGQDPVLLAQTERFLDALLWGLPGMLGVVYLRCFTTAFGVGRPLLVATLVVVPLNAVLAYGLIFGELGLPDLGLVGSGIASAVSHAAMFGILLAWCVASPRFRRYLVPFRPWPERALLARYARVGLPIGGALLMESGLFSAAALLMGRIGAVPLAAHQVTVQLCATMFMVPLGIGMAATVRVGLAKGAGDLAAARRAGLVAGVLGTGVMAAVALLFWFGGGPMVGLFLRDGVAGAAETAALAVALLQVAALFQLVDGVQVVGISSLRGLGDTRVPMWIAALGYWAVGIPISAALGLYTGLGPMGVWVGLAAGLTVVAALLTARFLKLTAAGRGR